MTTQGSLWLLALLVFNNSFNAPTFWYL